MRKETVLDLLNQWLESDLKPSRKLLSEQFCETVGEDHIVGISEEEREILRDLAYDFAFYSIDDLALAEEPTLRDCASMRVEVENTLSICVARGKSERAT